MWPDRRFLKLVGIDNPIIQAPMIGQGYELASLVSQAGGLGSIACSTFTPEQVRDQVEAFRKHSDKPFNLNFFCHQAPTIDAERDAQWRKRLEPYYREYGLDPAMETKAANRAPFNAAMCDMVESLRPPVVSFHFGLPDVAMVERLLKAGCLVLSSATTVAEAVWLEKHHVSAVIAQGAEAGGHRGMFLTDDLGCQVGTFALVPQIADAVKLPVVAAGGIADARGIVAAFALGACGVQIGTAYLKCKEAKLSNAHRAALQVARDDSTALTNVFTGRPARGILNRALSELGPISQEAPAFPRAAFALQPLRDQAEANDRGDFTPLWSGQAAALAAASMGAFEYTSELARRAEILFKRFNS